VAGRRWGDGQGPFWRDLVGPNPTDRGKKGVKRSLLVEADGGPLSVVLAGANVRDDKLLLEATLEAIVVASARDPRRRRSSTCAWTRATTTARAGNFLWRSGATSPTSSDGLGKRSSMRRARSATRRGGGWWSGRWGGCLEVPGAAGSLGEEGLQLPGAHQGGLHPHLVSSPAPSVPFEIVSK
jgi:hypothetical protein